MTTTLADTVVEVRRRWRTLLIVTVLIAAIGLGWLSATPVTYTASTQLLVSVAGSTTSTAYQNDDIARERINSYIPLIASDVVAQRVVDALGLRTSARDVADRVSATRVPPNTSIIDLETTANSADAAEALADSYARQFIAYTAAIETATGADSHRIRVTEIGSASDARDDTAIRIAVGALVVLVAVLLGVVAVWVASRATPGRDPGRSRLVDPYRTNPSPKGM